MNFLAFVEMPRSDVRLSLRNVTASLFRPHVGTEFVIHTPDGIRRGLVLAKVAERPLTRNVAQFYLIFHETAEMGVGDGIYLMHHRALGNFELFMVPIGARENRRKAYQVCFSRFVNVQGPGASAGREG